MQINPGIFKAYDIRGIYPDEVNEEIAYRIGYAMVQWSVAREVVVGRDMRTSSPILTEALIKGITEAGANVLDVGLVSTPTFYFAVRHLKASAGIQVSASHNPKEYNGFKVVQRDEKWIIKVGGESGLREIRDLVMQTSPHPSPLLKGEGKVMVISGIQEAEVDAALKLVPIPSEMSALTIVADPANAMGAQYLDALFARIPAVKLMRMNFELDGTFPAHQPDPFQIETLHDLQARVRMEKADLGLAPDGDGDRLFFLDEHGEVIPTSHITALVAQEVLRERPNQKILYDIRYTNNAKHTVEKYGGIPIVTKVGHANITNAMRKEDGAFGGESSGHFYFRDTGYAEGPLLVLLHVLRLMVRERKPISQILKPLIVSYESGEINFKPESREKAQKVIQELERRHKDGIISRLDGIAVEFPEWRFNVRTSNTEPLLRLNVEGETREIVKTKKQELASLCQ